MSDAWERGEMLARLLRLSYACSADVIVGLHDKKVQGPRVCLAGGLDEGAQAAASRAKGGTSADGRGNEQPVSL